MRGSNVPEACPSDSDAITQLLPVSHNLSRTTRAHHNRRAEPRPGVHLVTRANHPLGPQD
ncbi:hypothetical protein GCM10027586_18240 [Kineococcus gypseus]